MDGAGDADDEPFVGFVRARTNALVRFAYVLCGDGPQAEDLVQTALLKTYRRSLRPPPIDAWEAYVRRAIANEYASSYRRPASRERPAALVDGSGPDLTDQVAEQDAMWHALLQLPARQRAVLVLRHYERMSDAQIADLLGCATGSVRSLASRAIAILRTDPQLAGLDQPTSATDGTS